MSVAEPFVGHRLWPLIKSFLFVFVAPGFFAGYAPVLIATIGRDWAVDFGMFRHAAWICWTIGTAVLIACAWNFGVEARSSPALFDKPKRLMVHGPYRYVRNPMYLAQLLVVFGHFLWTGVPTVLAYLVLYWITVYLVATYHEERRLARKFERAYQHYQQNVSGWLPSLHPYVIPDEAAPEPRPQRSRSP